MKKLLSLLGSVAIVGGSSATIVACGSKPKESPKENPIDVAKEKLKNLIDEAQGLVNTSKKEESVTQTLQDAIGKAQEVLDKAEVTETELTSATTSLQAAIESFNGAKNTIDIAREALQAKITEAEALVKNSKKEESVTKALQDAISAAQKVLDDTQATEATIKGETTKLTQAINSFNDAKNTIDIAREDLKNKIAEAQKLVDTSKKEESVTKALQDAISAAQKVLDDTQATEATIKGETTKLTQAINQFNQSQDLDKQLQAKIEEIKQSKTNIENENNQNGWAAISEKSQTDFDSAIKEAEALVEKSGLTKEEVTTQFKKLDGALESFKLTLPQNIVSEAINLQKDNIGNSIFKGWSYASFFDAKAQEKDRNARPVNILQNEVIAAAKEQQYTEDEQSKLSELVVKHFAEKVDLVYLHDQGGQQKIKNIINQDEINNTLEQILHNNVKQEFPDADLTDPSFWESHPLLSLGIKFGVENLNPKTKEFWSFTFIDDISANDKDAIQQLFKEAEERDGGWIILDIHINSTPFVTAATLELQKKVFYGKRFISILNPAWTSLPNQEQIKNKIKGWKSVKDSDFYIKSTKSNENLFRVKTNIMINII